jgi:hypothetical protein
MVQVKSVKTYRDKNGKIIGYRIRDLKGQEMDITSDKLKFAIANAQLSVLNLTLTSNNRLIEKGTGSIKDLSLFSKQSITSQIPPEQKKKHYDMKNYNNLVDLSFIDGFSRIIGSVMYLRLGGNINFLKRSHLQDKQLTHFKTTNNAKTRGYTDRVYNLICNAQKGISINYGVDINLVPELNTHALTVDREFKAIENKLISLTGTSEDTKEVLSNILKLGVKNTPENIVQILESVKTQESEEVDARATSIIDKLCRKEYKDAHVRDFTLHDKIKSDDICSNIYSALDSAIYTKDAERLLFSLPFNELQNLEGAMGNRRFSMFGTQPQYLIQVKRDTIKEFVEATISKDSIKSAKGIIESICDTFEKTFTSLDLSESNKEKDDGSMLSWLRNGDRNKVHLFSTSASGEKTLFYLVVSLIDESTVSLATYEMDKEMLRKNSTVPLRSVSSIMALAGLHNSSMMNYHREAVKIKSAYDFKAILYKIYYTRVYMWYLETFSR